MSCDRTRELILLFLAGELAEEEAELLRPHLLACPDCTRHMGEQRRMLKALASVGEVEPSQEFAGRTAATVRLGLQARRRSPLARLATRPGVEWAVGVAAALLLFAAFRWLPGGLLDRPFDLRFLDPDAGEMPAPARSAATWEAADMNDAIGALREDLALAAPGSSDTDRAAATTPSGGSWSEAVDALDRETRAWEWDVTSLGRSRWTSHVDEIEARMDALAAGLEEG
jgi:hypothetical protein